MNTSELHAILPFCEPATHAEIVAIIQAENYPGIDNQMKSHVYGPWLELDLSDAFAAEEADAVCNGDHDCMAAHCNRCGFSFHEQLY